MSCSPIRDVDAVLNLTIPAAHAEVAPARARRGQARLRREAAGADDGGGAAACWSAQPTRACGSAARPTRCSAPASRPRARVLDDGRIGDAGRRRGALDARRGTSSGTRRPAFYYQPGGGPLFDMGPYYLTSLVTFFGPVVACLGRGQPLGARARRSRRARYAGTLIPVDVDTHVTAILEHANGVISTRDRELRGVGDARAAVRGLRHGGTIAVPDPNRFSDTVAIATATTASWREVPGVRRATRTPAAASASPTWPARSRPDGRTAHPASSPSTCSRSWSRSSAPAGRTRS